MDFSRAKSHRIYAPSGHFLQGNKALWPRDKLGFQNPRAHLETWQPYSLLLGKDCQELKLKYGGRVPSLPADRFAMSINVFRSLQRTSWWRSEGGDLCLLQTDDFSLLKALQRQGQGSDVFTSCPLARAAFISHRTEMHVNWHIRPENSPECLLSVPPRCTVQECSCR